MNDNAKEVKWRHDIKIIGRTGKIETRSQKSGGTTSKIINGQKSRGGLRRKHGIVEKQATESRQLAYEEADCLGDAIYCCGTSVTEGADQRLAG